MSKHLVAGLFILSLVACTDDEHVVIKYDISKSYTDIIPYIADADGILISTKNSFFSDHFGETIERNFGTATAVFYLGEEVEPINVGKVSIYNVPLNVGTNGRYTLFPTENNTTGIEFEDQVVWQVSGNNSFPEVNDIIKTGWPYASSSSHVLVIGEESFKVSLSYLSDADFTTYRMVNEIGEAVANVSYVGNKITHTFSADEIAMLGSGVYQVQVEVSKREEANVNAKKIYFINREIIYSQVLIDLP